MADHGHGGGGHGGGHATAKASGGGGSGAFKWLIYAGLTLPVLYGLRWLLISGYATFLVVPAVVGLFYGAFMLLYAVTFRLPKPENAIGAFVAGWIVQPLAFFLAVAMVAGWVAIIVHDHGHVHYHW